MIGEKFGKWTVVEMTTVYRTRKNRTACVVQCECGNRAIREPYRLRSGRTKCCPDCVVKVGSPNNTQKFRKEPGVAAINRYYASYKKNAEAKDRDFEIGREEFESLATSDCYYCGAPPSTRLRSDWDEVYANGIDRLDSDKGYTAGNIVTACWICNSAKKNMTQEDFINWLLRAAKHLSGKVVSGGYR